MLFQCPYKFAFSPRSIASHLQWKHQGECENNTRFMLWNCPVSCNLCTPPCEDTHGGFVSGPNANETMCDKWARDGACQGNPDFALKVCPVACNVCKPKCKDLHADCSSWSAAGSCETNPKYMLNNCPASCRVCGHSADVGAEEAKPADDSHGCKNVESAEACAAWKDAGECTENPAFMLRKCAESCELCTHVCQDHLAECSQWAKAGQCEENQVRARSSGSQCAAAGHYSSHRCRRRRRRRYLALLALVSSQSLQSLLGRLPYLTCSPDCMQRARRLS